MQTGIICERPIFWAYPNRFGLQPLFGELRKRGAPDEVVFAYRNAVANLPAFDSTRAKFESLSENQINSFVAASLDAVRAWQGVASKEGGVMERDGSMFKTHQFRS
jgi:hypothetical protein